MKTSVNTKNTESSSAISSLHDHQQKVFVEGFGCHDGLDSTIWFIVCGLPYGHCVGLMRKFTICVKYSTDLVLFGIS